MSEQSESTVLLTYKDAAADLICGTAAVYTHLKENKEKRPDPIVVLQKCIKAGHTSVLEHSKWTFELLNVSMVTLNQLARHRIGVSMSVQSARYSERCWSMYKPKSIKENKHANYMFDDLFIASVQAYTRMIELGIPAEDARYVIPAAGTYRVLITFNGRSLRHFIALRCSAGAQEEIREIAILMYGLVKKIAPIHVMGVEYETVNKGGCFKEGSKGSSEEGEPSGQASVEYDGCYDGFKG